MSAELLDMGGEGRPLVFLHANGYPPMSYVGLFTSLQHAVRILALEHRPLWGERDPPATLRWSLFADDLLAVLEREFNEPVWIVGHSMGGTTALLAADRQPQRIAGLILLDPVFIADRHLFSMRLMTSRQRSRMPMIRSALRRPECFPSMEAAFEFYRSKRAFSGLDDAALWDYVKASKSPQEDGRVCLRFPRSWEAAIYETVPRVSPLIKRLRLSTLGLRGRDSNTLTTAVFRRWQHWQPGATLRECPGGHLFPLEQPRAAAQMITEFLAEQP